MFYSTHRKCWKCGVSVRHQRTHTPYPKTGTKGQRRAWWFSKWFNAPVKHFGVAGG